MFIYYICRRNSRLAAAAREATATSKRLRTRLKSAKVRFDNTHPEERNKNMRSSFHFIIFTSSIRVTIIFLFLRD